MRSSRPRPLVLDPYEGILNQDLLVSLLDRRVRDHSGLFISTGYRFLIRAVECGAPLAGLVVSSRAYGNHLAAPILKRATALGLPICRIRANGFDQLYERLYGSLAPEPQDVILLHRQKWESLPLRVLANDFWLGVESIRTSGNLGAILRTAEAAGARGIIVLGDADPFCPMAVRATMGSLYAHRFIRATHRDFRRWKRMNGVQAVGATAEGASDFREIEYRRSTVIMVGEERAGFSAAQRKSCDQFARIPMAGEPNSLNVAVAASLMLYESYRQRHPPSR